MYIKLVWRVDYNFDPLKGQPKSVGAGTDPYTPIVR